MITLRQSLLPYIKQLAANVTASGAPPMRPLFYDFPDDAAAWAVDDQFMFGGRVRDFNARLGSALAMH